MMYVALLIAQLVLLARIVAHGNLVQPLPTFFQDGEAKTVYVLALDGSQIWPEYKAYDGWGEVYKNAQRFAELFDNGNGGYTSVKSIFDRFYGTGKCGNTNPLGTPRDVSNFSSFQWENNGGEGFSPSHRGPCEAWIDDVKVFHDDDCAATYTGIPANVPIDYSSCQGSCNFHFYWLALHEQNIQFYINCVPITNNGQSRAAQYWPSNADQHHNQLQLHPQSSTMIFSPQPSAQDHAPQAHKQYSSLEYHKGSEESKRYTSKHDVQQAAPPYNPHMSSTSKQKRVYRKSAGSMQAVREQRRAVRRAARQAARRASYNSPKSSFASQSSPYDGDEAGAGSRSHAGGQLGGSWGGWRYRSSGQVGGLVANTGGMEMPWYVREWLQRWAQWAATN